MRVTIQLADVLADFVGAESNSDVTAVERRLRAPVRVAVRGRRGVGRATVAAALSGCGVAVTDRDSDAEVRVVVIAETVTADDRALLTGAPVPTLVVLNKADLGGPSPAGPLAEADETAAWWGAALGLPVVPLIALLASVELSGEHLTALRALVAAPADLASVDAFVGCTHPVPAPVRRDLIDRLDRVGLAHAILAMTQGPADGVTARLRAVSRIDAVLAALADVAAPARYARVRAALRTLRVLATRTGTGERLAALLDGDEVALAVMTAAVDVVEARGAPVDHGSEADAHSRRAALWQARAGAPLDVLHRRCAADIARGSLRLLGGGRRA